MSIPVNNYKDMIEELQPESQNILQIIRETVGNNPLNEIAKKMGYIKIEKGVERIKFIIDDPYLGLLKSNYDGLYSSATFLTEFLEIIGLKNNETLSKYIEHISFLSLDASFGYSPCIFCDTNFNRRKCGSPIFVLAALNNRRFLPLSKTIKRKSKSEKIKIAKEVIFDHQQTTGGKIDLWGTVVKYVCHFDKNEIIEFLPDGTIICEKNEPVFHPGAYLKIGNKVLAGRNS